MTRLTRRPRRRGSMLPLVASTAIGLFAFVALAIDLGMLAVSRTQCQNAADSAALAGCRTLNNKPGAVNNDLQKAVQVAKETATANNHLAAHFTTAQVSKIEAGQYLYDPTSQLFRVSSWTNVTNSQGATPPSGSWTGMRVTINVTQPTYFMKVMGVNSMPTGAVATAVHRPRDVAFVLDMTGSMGYASSFNFNGVSLNPDPLVPSFGHYTNVQSSLVATANQANASGEAYSRNNYTVATPGGPPIVRYFSTDPANAANPTNSAFPVTLSGSSVSLVNAFHWAAPESGGNLDTYTAPTFDFTGYNAYHTVATANRKGPTPAPDSFGTMTDTGTNTYVGDRWRRANGSINKTSTSWAISNSSTKAASSVVELLGYNVSGSNVRRGISGTTTIATVDQFRDPVWEQHGYDLDIPAYRTWKTNSNSENPGNPGSFSTLVPAADRYQGFSMGPGYWGKTFYIWPPDPRAPVGNPGDANYQAGDWRRRYFLNRNGAALDPQSDNNPNTTGTGNFEGINEVLLNTSAGGHTLSGTTANWQINYTAVLRWIKSGPQTLPPNLRAGRVLYYSSIPDDVNTNTGTAQQRLDKLFWQKYIEFVFSRGYTGTNNLYGTGDSWSGATTSISTSDMATWTGPSGSWSAVRPYMRYNDSPNRPRLHFWFGPLSMMDFITKGTGSNLLPGTCTEAQCWQLKAGVNAVLDDVRNNHPNDYVGLVMFAANSYNGIRRPMGQNYLSLKNALFYPKSLLNTIDGGDKTTELRPYDSSFAAVGGDEIPNASGSTDPNTGLAYAYNLLSPSALLPAEYGSVRGRRGAQKVVIFETDGVPNTYRGLSSGTKTMNPTLRGFDTYYQTSGWSSGNVGNGNATSINEAVKIVKQMTKPMAATNGSGQDSGLSLPNAPCRVYPIAFGDLFDTDLSPSATFRPTALAFLADIAYWGNTGQAGATTLPSAQIITGSYQQRIDRLKDCMMRIFQSGVAVVLIE